MPKRNIEIQQRYYDPAIRRFLSVDPVGPLRDPVRHFGRYEYAYNKPHRYTDRDGRIPVDTLVDVGFLIYDGGRFLGAAAAAGVGAATGNEAPRSEGLAGMRAVAPDLIDSAVSVATPYASAPMIRATASGVHGSSRSGESLKEQARELVLANDGKVRVEIRSPSRMHQTGLTGKSQAGVETPQTRVSERNLRLPFQSSCNARKSEVRP